MRRSALRAFACHGVVLVWLLGVAAHFGWIANTGAILGVAAYLAVAVLAWRPLLSGHPHARFGAANVITLIRATAVVLLGSLLGGPELSAPAGHAVSTCALLLIALDGLDGTIARRTGLASPFGARFDMEIDALTILVLGALLVAQGRIGPWALAAGSLRYLMLAAAWIWPWLAMPLPESDLRRAICVVLGLSLALAINPIVPVWLARPLVAIGLAAVTYSFARDVVWLRRRRAVSATPLSGRSCGSC
ncbi:MAG: CDP-alcohol phosphatidyltransferase family protein [Proteobacteria bacterium]|nr:CDP-alcohol phosphatidyltransferase family protein [Pseudomonadota bacterium]